MKTSSTKFRITAIAGACAVAIGVGSLVAINAVSATDVDEDDTSQEPILPTDCSVEALPIPEGAEASSATHMSTNGEFIVGSYFTRNSDDYFDQYPVIWHDGELANTVDFPKDLSHFQGITTSGLAVGTVMHPVREDTYTPGAYTYHDGESIKLEDELSSQGTGINDHGDAVGIIEHHETNLNQAAQFFEDENELLDVPEDSSSSAAIDIDNDGNIVGFVDELDFGYPYRWTPDGEGEKLTISEDEDYTATSGPSAINNGITVGSAYDADNNQAAVVWELEETEGTVIDLDSAHDVNADGWIIGTVDLAAAAYVDGEVFELPRLYEDSPTEDQAIGISEDGSVIAGTANYGPTESESPGEAVTWSCG